MNKKVEELVEWVAMSLALEGHRYNPGGIRIAKIILSHPDLALIDWERMSSLEKLHFHSLPIIPLAEALKEVKDE